MKSFVKWAGGKEKEIKYFESQFPEIINNYYEPFLGGGSVFFYLNDNCKIKKSYINDFSKELIDLYRAVKKKDVFFFSTLSCMNDDLKSINNFCLNNYQQTDLKKSVDLLFSCSGEKTDILVDETDFLFEFNNKDIDIKKYKEIAQKILFDKINRLKKIQTKSINTFSFQSENFIETVLKSAYYTYIRFLYNSSKKNKIDSKNIAYFYYLREYCYSSMFRFNSNGDFNVPYGGMAYNQKYLDKKIEYFKSSELHKILSKTNIYNNDFALFLKGRSFLKDDFIFVDPPYDTEFSEYDNNSFNKEDQKRLALLLYDLKESTCCNIMVVIKNTDFIKDLYLKLGFKIQAFDKKYSVNFMNRNVRDVEHLIITNY